MQAALALELEYDDAPASGTCLVAARQHETTAASSFVEVALPMRLSHKWVAFACRTAGVAKPRWNRHTQIWTTHVMGESGATEQISITSSENGHSIRILAEWLAPEDSILETATSRRLATAFVTIMRDAMRHRSMLRQSYADLSRAISARPANS